MRPNPSKTRGAELSLGALLAGLSNVRLLIRMVWETSPLMVVGTVSLRMIRSVLPLAMLWIPKLILDALVNRRLQKPDSPTHIWRLVILEFALAIISDVLGRGNALVDGLLADRFAHNMSIRLMKHAATLDLTFFEDPTFYDKLERTRRQTAGRLALLASALNIWQDLLSLIWLSSGLAFFSPWLIVFLGVTVVPAFLGETRFTALAYSALYRLTPERRRLDYLRFLGASVQTAKEIKIFGLGEHLVERFTALSDTIIAENRGLALKRAVDGSGLNAFSTLGYYGVYAFVLFQALAGGITIGMFTFLASTFTRSRTYIERMFSNLSDMTEESLYLKDLIEFLEMRPTICSRERSIPAPRPIRRGFELQNVGFVYPGSEHWVLRNLNLHLPADQKIALIGENGCGKSTLVKLLARLYDPSEGRILLDGVDLREYDVEDLRREIGVIFQDYVRYDTSVRDNIGFGKIEDIMDESRIDSAAQKSRAKSLIDKLPGGYQQQLGRRFEGGMDLSGGEWQKLGLARAYMRDAQVLILDEPTASLDARAEHKVFERFAALTNSRLIILISHRFSTVRMADHIVVLGDGVIQEQGTHDRLVALGGRYAELFSLQASGYR